LQPCWKELFKNAGVEKSNQSGGTLEIGEAKTVDRQEKKKRENERE